MNSYSRFTFAAVLTLSVLGGTSALAADPVAWVASPDIAPIDNPWTFSVAPYFGRLEYAEMWERVAGVL